METLYYNQTNGNTNLKQQVKDIPNNLLTMFNPKSVDQALFKQCKFHSDQDCDFIVITKNAEYSRVCIKCMKEKDILFSNIISIRQLLFSNPQPLLSRYPVLINQEVSINKLKAAKDLRDAVQLQINEYKQNFINLMNSTNSKESQLTQELKQMEECYQEMMITYTDISNINKFKSIIINSNSDDETEIKNFVNIHCEQSEANSALLDKKIAEFNQVWSNFQVDLHQEDFNQIILKINSFQFITRPLNISQKQQIEQEVKVKSKADDQFSQQRQQNIEDKQADKCKNSEEEGLKQSQELLSLQQLNKELLEKQEQESKQAAKLIIQLESQVDTLQKEVKRLKEQITDLSTNLKVSEQQSKLEKDVIQDQLDKLRKEKQQIQMELYEIKQQPLINNLQPFAKRNETDMADQIKQQQNRICQYDKELPQIKMIVQQLSETFYTDNKSIINQINPDQLAQISQKIQELSIKLKEDVDKINENIKPINQQQQILNEQIIYIEKLQIFMREINEKLFEVINEQINILPHIQLQLSNSYKDSKNLEINTINLSQIIVVKISKSPSQNMDSGLLNLSQCYINQPLQQDKKYKIRLQLNGTNQVAFGLISEEQKDKSQVQEFKIFYSEIDGGSCKKIIKGTRLESRMNIFKQGKILEIRISQKDNIFKVGDYPDYQNVNQIENCYPKWAKYAKLYFAIWLSSEFGPNEVKILEFCQINQFDQNM